MTKVFVLANGGEILSTFENEESRPSVRRVRCNETRPISSLHLPFAFVRFLKYSFACSISKFRKVRGSGETEIYIYSEVLAGRAVTLGKHDSYTNLNMAANYVS